MHPNSAMLFEKYARPRLSPAMRLLEVGPDTAPSGYFALGGAARPAVWDTADFPRDFPCTFTLSDEYRFPIDSDAYDVVLSGQVLEHVRMPWRWLPELARVCRPGGLVVTISPVSWPYHEAPVDCWRAHPEGMRSLYGDAGLDVLECACECLEVPPGTPTIPGRSATHQPPTSAWRRWLLRKLGAPAEAAFDTATVGRKPG